MANAPSVLAIHLPDALQEQDAFLDKRWAIWRASKPLFERHGFSDVTFEQVAHASGMVPITIYRYFPNKQAVALFPLAHTNGLQHAWHRLVAKLPANPELRLEKMDEFAAVNGEAWRLAATLADEMSMTSPALERYANRMLKEAREDFTAIVRSVDPGMSPERFRVLYGMLTSSIPRATHSGLATSWPLRSA
ncbi:MAG TPA: helix-turn-helix domain-containing protein [Candidatus Limnocylindrales bacterium]|nr:helix-turn-helix domain-containing protein [Candidatus Limnocylindrales bacterium]